MFRRSKTETAATTVADAPTKPGGKGRPTPTRKEAEAAARERARTPANSKEARRKQRTARAEQTRKMREGMKTGDERYLLPRDKGPVRRFVRDFVDSRFSFAEVVIPLMLVSLFVPNLVLFLFPVLLVDLLILRYRVRKQIRLRFPDAPLKGITYYAVTRGMQMKFMRLPKPQVRIGEKLPDTYR